MLRFMRFLEMVGLLKFFINTKLILGVFSIRDLTVAIAREIYILLFMIVYFRGSR